MTMKTADDAMGTSLSKPKLISILTGTGIYIPTADNARCLIRQVGGGGGGASYGGGGGAYVEFVRRIPIAGLSYSVGAGGVGAAAGGTGGNGSATKFDTVTAPGGQGGYGSGGIFGGGRGGIATSAANGVSTATITAVNGGVMTVPGGCGGTTAINHGAAGFPFASQQNGGSPTSDTAANHQVGTATASGSVGCGGDSFLGRGGNSNNAGAGANGAGYGAGGGGGSTAGGNGSAGTIEVWDMGV